MAEAPQVGRSAAQVAGYLLLSRDVGSPMVMRATRWAIAALIGSAMTTVGCMRPIDADEPVRARQPIVADDSVVHALDTRLEMRLIDRLEMDAFLRDRDIDLIVIDGVVHLKGEVWTPLEKQRASEIVRDVAGVVDVANDLVVAPPE